MDKQVLKNRLDAYELQCDVNEGNRDSQWIVHEGQLVIPTRRLREIIKLARVGLEHVDAD